MTDCQFESAVLEAVASGEWSEELDAHTGKCPVCQDLKLVAQALADDYAVALSDLNVCPAGLVWWRAELAARSEVARKVTRPITLVHALAVACALGIAFALGRLLITPTMESIPAWADMVAGSFGEYGSGFLGVVSALLEPTANPIGIAVALLIGCCLLSAPVAVYILLSDD